MEWTPAHLHFFLSGHLFTWPGVIDLRRFWSCTWEIAWLSAAI